jgi:hypothetical protein
VPVIVPRLQLAEITVDCRDTSLVGTDDLVGADQQLGGRSLDEGTVMVMADPEGNELCLVQHRAVGVLGSPEGT